MNYPSVSQIAKMSPANASGAWCSLSAEGRYQEARSLIATFKAFHDEERNTYLKKLIAKEKTTRETAPGTEFRMRYYHVRVGRRLYYFHWSTVRNVYGYFLFLSYAKHLNGGVGKKPVYRARRTRRACKAMARRGYEKYAAKNIQSNKSGDKS